ncbi:MAG: hypothetical protein JJ975_05030 [Bacteroidia bacterium]|nr:hypothetical protein [Bacteroidia bacterium]
MKTTSIATVLLLLPLMHMAQIPDGRIERLVENGEFLENQTLSGQRLNLNTCSAHALYILGIINTVEIKRLLNHRERYGGFLDILELQQCNISPEAISVLKNHVYVTASWPLSRLAEKPGHTLWLYAGMRSPRQLGFTTLNPDGRFRGLPIQHSFRYKGHVSQNLELGFMGENDAGEANYLTVSPDRFDFSSGYVRLTNWGNIHQLVLGDYTLNMGQGLVIGNRFGSGKSSLVLNVTNTGKFLRPNTSMNENNAIRGIAMEAKILGLDMLLFGGITSYDANLDTIGDLAGYSSLQQTGLHRTAEELRDKNSLSTREVGYSVSRSVGHLTIGQCLYFNTFSHPRFPSNQAYAIPRFNGASFVKTSVYYQFQLNNGLWFGELAYDTRNWAGLSGLLLSFGKSLDGSLVYRKTQAGFTSRRTQSFSEFSPGSSEQGLYGALCLKPANTFSFKVYFDFYSSSWLRYNSTMPTKGRDYFGEFIYHPRKTLEAYARVKTEIVDVLSPGKAIQREVVTKQLSRFRFHVNYQLSKELLLRSRYEYSIVRLDNQKTNGSLLYQDVKLTPRNARFGITTRFTIVSINQFDNRIYAYENDVPLSYSIPFFSRNGNRMYVLFSYRLHDQLKIWMRFALDSQLDDHGFGSGLDRTSGRRRSEVRLMLKAEFR